MLPTTTRRVASERSRDQGHGDDRMSRDVRAFMSSRIDPMLVCDRRQP